MSVFVKGRRRPSGNLVEVEVNEVADGGGVDGGGGKSELKAVRFDFAFDTPGLNAGVDVYVPKVGEILRDAFFTVTSPFDGTTPGGDVTVAPCAYGLFGAINAAHALSGATPTPNGLFNDIRAGQGSLSGVAADGGLVPAMFTTINPLKLFVNQNGKCDGSGIPLNSTTGEATLVVIVST